jgi:hypothetical protein
LAIGLTGWGLQSDRHPDARGAEAIAIAIAAQLCGRRDAKTCNSIPIG